MRRLSLALGTGAFVAPLVVAFAACSVDGATPDCSKPGSGCEPSAPNANPDARPGRDAPATDTGTGTDANVSLDAGDASDATDAAFDGDAKLDGDAKTG